MSTSAPVPDLSPLGVLGFSARQEEVYRMLLRNADRPVESLAELLGLPLDELRDHVHRFVAAGLVELRGDVLVVHPPNEALSRMINDETRRLQSREDQLEAVRGLLPSLSAEHLTSSAPRGEAVTLELVDGGEVVHLIASLASASSGDLLWLRPDQWALPIGEEIDTWVSGMLRSGRRSRAIYPARVLQEAPDVLRGRAEAGEHVRILAELPCRLAVLGSSAALVSEEFGVPSERRLVVRQRALVAALRLMFEQLWNQAMVVPGMDGQRYDGGAAQELLLDQLGQGARDEQIARALGVSVRTVRRRVADLLEELGAESRFQAGVEAVRRGWV